MKRNENYDNLTDSYLFSTIHAKVVAHKATHPARIISLGIGDVTKPLCPAVISALHTAVDEMGNAAMFRGYGPEQGYAFLREAICGYYATRGVVREIDEIFVSDGAKSDIGNILDLFDRDNTVQIPDPVYPVYADTNIMDGRRIIYTDATEENAFLPLPDESACPQIIYICSPNNPTGAVYDRAALEKWVAYARAIGAVILFDAAYERFVTDPLLPRSIYEIAGAEECAIEFCSFSKTAGFTGLRCGYTVVPRALGRLREMWLRRQTTKFNGVSYIVQRAAAAVFSPEGAAQIDKAVGYYLTNARIIAKGLSVLKLWYTGGKNSPYIWLRCPAGLSSWDFFDKMLTQAGVVGTPGSGFGKNGEHYFRLTAFGDRQDTAEAVGRLGALCAGL